MSSKKERRARAKEQKRAAALAAHRRRRMLWAGAIAFAVIALGALAGVFAFGGDDEESDEPARAEEIACGDAKPPEADARQYEKPEQVLEDGVDYSAVVATSCGVIELDLLEKRAPKTVNNFVFLAREGYFDGLLWHRIVPGFVIQTGDPNGVNGQEPDGPGYTIPDELPTGDNPYVVGAVAMANTSQPNTGGSQWFIVTAFNTGLTNTYSLFGQVDDAGQDVVARLGSLQTNAQEVPTPPAYVNSIEIVEK